jgi:hypothetical protein
MGGSSGGGSSSGKADYPDYMKTFHNDILDQTGTDTVTSSVMDAMNAALGNSPYTTLDAYDPTADTTAYMAVLTAFKAILAGVSDTADWATIYAQAKTTVDNVVDLAADIAAFADQLDDEITTKVLPRFRRGMQDINAVVSSAFPIGEAVIEGFRDREVAKYSSALRLKNADFIIAGTGQMLQLMIQRIGWEESYARTYVEASRIKIVAHKEQVDQDAKLDVDDALWDLELFKYGSNVLASIAGAVNQGTKGASTTQSMIGGAMAGAAGGAMIGGAPGAIIGGVLGAASGLL